MWYDTNWTHRIKVTIQASEVDATLTDFAVFVDLSDLPAGFHSAVKSDGSDIRVTRADGSTECAREVVEYDATGDKGELHFKANSISHTVDTDFYIYYGNAGASDYAVDATYGRENVWSDFKGVWHFNEVPNGNIGSGSQIYRDATLNENDGEEGYYIDMDASQSIDGIVGKALSFGEGIDDHILVPDDNSLDFGTGSFTVTGMFQVDVGTTSRYQGIIKKATGTMYTTYTGLQLGLWGNNEPMEDMQITAGVGDGSTVKKIIANNVSTYGASDWHIVKLVVDRSDDTLHLYIDGVEHGSGIDISAVGSVSNASDLLFGFDLNRMDGNLDEMRVKASADSADYASAEHVSLMTPGTFYDVGVEEDVPARTDTDDERDAEVSGSDDVTTDRGAEISGVDTNQSDRDAEVSGVDTSQASRDAEVSGSLTDNSNRDALITGVDTDQTERNAEIAGELTDNNTRSAEIAGTDTDQTERNAELSGADTDQAS